MTRMTKNYGLRTLIYLMIVLGMFVLVSGVSAEATALDGLSLPEADGNTVQKALEAVKSVLRAIGNWLTSIGIDIGRLIKLTGELIILIFQSLIKIVEWLVGLVR